MITETIVNEGSTSCPHKYKDSIVEAEARPIVSRHAPIERPFMKVARHCFYCDRETYTKVYSQMGWE